MSVKEYRFFGQVQEVNDIGETTDAGWSVFCTWVKQEDYARLKAEVERLRKAGDELLHEWSSGDETDGRNFKKGLVLWNAAKEGKQSEEVLWVQLEDYEKLKAEVERLRKWMDDISLDTEGRLDIGLNVGWTLLKIKQEYNAAKEGKPSV